MCSLIDILQWKKIQKYSDDFWHRKLTLKVKFWYFLTASHYSNFQNLVVSFEYSWFLTKNLSNFVSLPWKLHNRYCYNQRSLTERLNEALSNMDESNRELDRHRREATNRLEKDRTSIAELQIEVSKLRHLLSDKDNQLDDDKKSLLDRLNQEKQTRVKVS